MTESFRLSARQFFSNRAQKKVLSSLRLFVFSVKICLFTASSKDNFYMGSGEIVDYDNCNNRSGDAISMGSRMLDNAHDYRDYTHNYP